MTMKGHWAMCFIRASTRPVIHSVIARKGNWPKTRKKKEDKRDMGRMTKPITGVIKRLVSGETMEK